MDPINPHLVTRQALILSELGDYAAAERVLQGAIAIAPNISDFHAMLGTLLIRQQRNNDAKAALLEALRHEPDRSAYRAQLETLL